MNNQELSWGQGYVQDQGSWGQGERFCASMEMQRLGEDSDKVTL